MLTKDARIRTNELERKTLLAAKVAAFMLGRGDLPGPKMAQAFELALPRMKTALRRYDVPLIGVVTSEGGVTVLYESATKLAKPRAVK